MMKNWAITSLLQFSFGCNYNKHNLSSSLIYYSYFPFALYEAR